MTPVTAPVELTDDERKDIAQVFSTVKSLHTSAIIRKMKTAKPKASINDTFLRILKNLHVDQKAPYSIYLYAEAMDGAGFKRAPYSWPIGSKIRYTLEEATKEAQEIAKATGIEFVPYKEPV